MGCVVRNSRLRLNQGQIFWRETGQGEAIAFIHREYSESSQWHEFFEALHHDYHCFAPDLIGFGDSDPAIASQSIQWHSEILDDFFAHISLKKTYIIGDSLGAWIATRYAIDHSEQVQGLVLLDPIGCEAPQQANYFLARLLLLPVPIFPLLLKLIRPLSALFGLKKTVCNVLDYRAQLLRSPASRRLLFERHARQIQAEYLCDQLPSVEIPTLVLSSRQGDHQAHRYGQAIFQAKVKEETDSQGAIATLKAWLSQQRQSH